jgi:soluble lytic murein transglycosylase
MLAKGHNLPHLGLVAVLNVDQGLYSPDFRASERMGQLVVQVAGRSGRELRAGTTLIQTHRPDHPWLRQLLTEGYAGFARSLLAEPGMQRAFELYAVGLGRDARREWARALAGSSVATRREAALLANQRGWYDRAVFTFSSGDALRLYDLRFPLARQDHMVEQASQAGIDPAWAYAIARAESAWMTDAHSGADARGLMQLLPATGAQVARAYGLPWAGGDSLYDPVVNVQLGTRYLAQMAQRFNGAPWLASAAYNAGPVKVDQWLGERGSLPPDLFTATIPYKETREYVARVMAFSVIYDWRLTGRAVPLDARMTPIGQAYVPPGPGAVRKPVACPAAPVAAAPAGVAAGTTSPRHGSS